MEKYMKQVKQIRKAAMASGVTIVTATQVVRPRRRLKEITVKAGPVLVDYIDVIGPRFLKKK